MNFFKLYIGDYQRDTAHLSMAEHGAYLLMLQHYYATERPLPIGKALHRMLRAQDKDERDAIDSVTAQFWTTTEAGLVNERASNEIGKADHQREVNRTVGKLGGRPKRTQTESVSESVSESVTETQTEPEPINNPIQTPDTRHQTKEQPPTPLRGSGRVHGFPPGFERFWEAYPRKTAKPTAARSFARIRPDDALLQRMLAAIAAQKQSAQWTKDSGEFIPHPATWLNARRWEDEAPRQADPFAGAM